MTRVVVGPDGPIARALLDAPPLERMGAAASAILEQRPDELAIVVTGGRAAPVGTLTTEELGEVLGRTVGLGLVAVKIAGQLDQPVRVAMVAPACALRPDHRDGLRSVAGAGIAMLTELAAAAPGLTACMIAVADDVPAGEIAVVADLVLGGRAPALNGAMIRLDRGRDAVLAAVTRAEEA